MNFPRRWLDAYAAYTTQRPLVVLALCLALTLAAGWIASGLTFESSYAALLPDNSPEIHEIELIKEKGINTTELVVVVSGSEEARVAFALRAAASLRESPWARRADVAFGAGFFEDRKLLLLPTEKLAEMETALRTSVRKVKQRANPLFVSLDDTDPWEDLKAFEAELNDGEAARPPGEYLTSRDGRSLYMVVQPGAATGEVGNSKQALAEIQGVVAGLDPEAAGVEVTYAGRLMVLIEEQEVLERDLLVATLVALVLVILMLTLWTRRASTLLVLGVPLTLGIIVTLAVTRLVVGQLNLVSGFMIPALVGLGVDFCIHLYLRFLEGVDEERLARPVAMQNAINETFGACLASALTTVGAFFALLSSDFKGVSEYGLVAGVGVVVTLLVSFVVLPPLGVLVVRAREAVTTRSAPRPLPRRLALVLVVCMGAFGAYAASTADAVSFKNDFRQLRGDSKSEAYYDTITDELGGPLDPALIMVGDLEQARRAETLLRDAAKAQSGAEAFHFGRILSLATLVPDAAQFDAREAILEKMRETLESVPRRRLSDTDKARFDDLTKLASATPWTVEEIPEPLRERMRLGGGENLFVLVWSKRQLYRDQDVIRWADNLDALLAQYKAEGIEASTLDEIRVTARMLKILQADFPNILLYASLAVLLILIIYFRSLRKVALVGGSLVTGVVMMLGFMAAFGIDLNLFNAVVIPTVVGIGIDNAVHIQHGYDLRGRGSVAMVVATKGRAALMASMTTAIGFGVMIIAHHYGVYTLGALALVGVGCTFAATTILLPSLLRVLEGDRSRGDDPDLRGQ